MYANKLKITYFSLKRSRSVPCRGRFTNGQLFCRKLVLPKISFSNRTLYRQPQFTKLVFGRPVLQSGSTHIEGYFQRALLFSWAPYGTICYRPFSKASTISWVFSIWPDGGGQYFCSYIFLCPLRSAPATDKV